MRASDRGSKSQYRSQYAIGYKAGMNPPKGLVTTQGMPPAMVKGLDAGSAARVASRRGTSGKTRRYN